MPRGKAKVEEQPPGEDLTINFGGTSLWTPQHVRECRDRYPAVELDVFKTMMQRAHALEVNPLTEIWQTPEGTFLLHAHAMFAYASRSGRYAPSSRPSEIERRDDLKGDTNPEGFGRIIVYIKLKVGDEWHDVPGEAYWGDLVPIIGSTVNRMNGQRKGGHLDPDSFWASMPFTMLRKNAYTDALARAFPELRAFRIEGSGVLSEEVERPAVDLGPKAVAPAPVQVGGVKVPSIEVRWLDGSDDMVPETHFAERVQERLSGASPQQIVEWFEANRYAVENFHHRDKKLSGHSDWVIVRALKDNAEEALLEREGDASQRGTPVPPATLAKPRRGRVARGPDVVAG